VWGGSSQLVGQPRGALRACMAKQGQGSMGSGSRRLKEATEYECAVCLCGHSCTSIGQLNGKVKISPDMRKPSSPTQPEPISPRYQIILFPCYAVPAGPWGQQGLGSGWMKKRRMHLSSRLFPQIWRSGLATPNIWSSAQCDGFKKG
jgi:hypothetical protein